MSKHSDLLLEVAVDEFTTTKVTYRFQLTSKIDNTSIIYIYDVHSNENITSMYHIQQKLDELVS